MSSLGIAWGLSSCGRSEPSPRGAAQHRAGSGGPKLVGEFWVGDVAVVRLQGGQSGTQGSQ